MKNKIILLFISILLVLFSTNIFAQELVYCGDGVSPCSYPATSFREDGGSEFAGTIDSCRDGTEGNPLFWVINFTVTSLNNSNFFVNDTVNISGRFQCSASNQGGRLAFVYNNANYDVGGGTLGGGHLTDWFQIDSISCDTNSVVFFDTELVLVDVAGNHSIRALATYQNRDDQFGDCVLADWVNNVTCGFNHTRIQDCFPDELSDTDDISFLVFPLTFTPIISPTILLPLNNSLIITNIVDINITYSNDDITEIKYYINNTLNQTTLNNITLNFNDGVYDLDVSVNNLFNTSSNTSILFTVEKDITSPNISTAISDSTPVENDLIQINGTCIDTNQDTVSLANNITGTFVNVVNLTTLESGTYIFNHTVVLGFIAHQYTCFDLANNNVTSANINYNSSAIIIPLPKTQSILFNIGTTALVIGIILALIVGGVKDVFKRKKGSIKLMVFFLMGLMLLPSVLAQSVFSNPAFDAVLILIFSVVLFIVFKKMLSFK